MTNTNSGMSIYESMLYMTFCHALLPEPLLFFSKHTEIKLRLLYLVVTIQAGVKK